MLSPAGSLRVGVSCGAAGGLIGAMPMDIALGSNTPTGTLELRAAQSLPDSSGFGALLVVRAGSFAAALPFFVTRSAVREFTDALGVMTNGANGDARLVAREGGDFVSIGRVADAVSVHGALSEDDGEQRLQFRFETRASGLAPLHLGLCRLLDSQVRS